jgi:hypothetical protein
VATSDARIEANRKNAQLSTGPKTPEGKAVCRQNALKNGLTGEGIVLPDEDREAISRGKQKGSLLNCSKDLGDLGNESEANRTSLEVEPISVFRPLPTSHQFAHNRCIATR